MADDLRFEPLDAEPVSAPPLPGIAEETPSDEGKTTKMSKKRKLALLGLGGLIAKIAIVGALHWYFVGANEVKTDNAYVGASTAQINSQVSGQLIEVRVEDTQSVRRGQILAVVDPTDAQLSFARAEADYLRTLQRVRQYYAQEASAAAQVSARQADLDRG